MSYTLPKSTERFGAAAALAALILCGAQAGFQSVHAGQPTEPLPDVLNKASKEASELLMAPRAAAADMTIKIVGDQGLWTATYVVPPGPAITSPPGEPSAKMSEAGEDLIVPQGKSVDFIFTSHDRLYELAIPDLDRVVSAIPGRLEMVQLLAIPSGHFSLVCSAGCEAADRATPFTICVVSPEDFEQWLRRKMDKKP